MSRPSTFPQLLLVATFLALALPAPSAAQPIWLERAAPRMLGIELLMPAFAEDDFMSAFIVHLSGRAQLSPTARLFVEVPYSNSTLDLGVFGEFKEEGIGNPLIGVELGAPDAEVFTQFGLRPPVTSLAGLAAGAAVLADFDRAEAFLPDILSASAAVNYRTKSATGLVVHLRAEPVLLVPTAEEDDDDLSPEVLLGYQGLLGFESGAVSVMGGITGRAIVTDNSLDLEERSIHQLTLNAGVWFGNLRPALHVRLPLDSSLSDALSSVIAVNLAIKL